MEDQSCSYLARKCNARKVKISCCRFMFSYQCFALSFLFHDNLFQAAQALELRIKKMAEIYNLGVGTLKELANTLHMKASTDMEHMHCQISSQMMATENFLAIAVHEAKDVICNIQNSLDEQKQLLAFSIQKQEEGLQRSLTSAHIVSEATMNFFNDIQLSSSRAMNIIEETHIERCNHLANFEKKFEKEILREEGQAIEKIAAILAALTSKRNAVVSEASRNMQDMSIQQFKRFQLEKLNMQQVSKDATKEVSEYVENAKSHFVEQIFSANDVKANMENFLLECSKTVDRSKLQWENAHMSLNNCQKSNLAEIESAVKENISNNHALNQEFVAASLNMESDYNAETCNLLADVDGALMLDHENKKEIDSMTRQLLKQLNSVQEKHSESVSNIHVQAEKSLVKDYLVDQNTTPNKRTVSVPSHASIEKMRTQITEDSSTQNQSKWIRPENKIHHPTTSPNRTPFTDVN